MLYLTFAIAVVVFVVFGAFAFMLFGDYLDTANCNTAFQCVLVHVGAGFTNSVLDIYGEFGNEADYFAGAWQQLPLLSCVSIECC